MTVVDLIHKLQCYPGDVEVQLYTKQHTYGIEVIRSEDDGIVYIMEA